MQNTIKTSMPNAAWAASGIISPFFFLPLDLSNNPVTARLVTNIANNIPAAFTIIDADGSVDAVDGFYTGDSATDLDAIWPGAGYDNLAYPMNKMFDIFDSNAHPKGRTLLFSWRAILGTLVAGTIFTFGSPGAGLKHSWKFSTVGNSLRLSVHSADGSIVLTNSDLTSIAVVPGTTECQLTALFDTKNGQMIVYQNNTALTNANLAAQLAAMANYNGVEGAGRPTVGITLASTDVGEVANARTVSAAMAGSWRSVLAMDLTDYVGAIPIADIAAAMTRAPAYTIPKYLARF